MGNLKLEEIGPSYDQNFVCLEISKQNILNKIKKCSKNGQD